MQYEDVPIKYSKHYDEFIGRRECEEKSKSELISCLQLVSRPPQSGCFFGKFTAEQVLKSFSGRNNSLMPLVFGFCNSLPFGFEESRE